MEGEDNPPPEPPGAGWVTVGKGGGKGNRANPPKQGKGASVGGKGASQGKARTEAKANAPTQKSESKANAPRAANPGKQKSEANAPRRTTADAGQASVPQGDRSGAEVEATGAAPAPPASLKRLWRSTGRCLVCGSESHRVVNCELRPPQGAPKPTPEAGDNKPVKGKSGNGGRKRPRGSASGLTPPAKKTSKVSDPKQAAKEAGGKGNGTGKAKPKSKETRRNFSYADAAKGKWEIALVNEEENHISKTVFNDIQSKFLEEVMLRIRENKWVPELDTWTYSTAYATVTTACEESRKFAIEFAVHLGFKALMLDELRAKRRPTKIFTGLVRGPVANLKSEEFARLIAHETRRSGYQGRVEFMSSLPTKSGNAIIRLRFDDIAQGRLAELNSTMRIGICKVMFHETGDAKLKKKNDVSKEIQRKKLEERLQWLNEEIDEAKSRMTEMSKDNFDATSVSSLGLSKLDVGEERMDAEENEGDEDATLEPEQVESLESILEERDQDAEKSKN